MTEKERISQEYKKQRDRLTAAIRRLKSQGFLIDYELPKIPKNKTEASISNLRKITPDTIREHSIFVDVTTGEKVLGNQKQTIKRLRKEQKKLIEADSNMESWIKNNIEFLQNEYSDVSRETSEQDFIGGDDFTGLWDEANLIADRIIEVFSEDVYETGNPRGVSIIMKWIEDFINRKGKLYVADVLKEASINNIQLNITPYSSDEELYGECQEFINRIMELDPYGGQRTSEQYANFAYENAW